MATSSKHIIVLRFSAMGDVVLVTPVIKSFLRSYPDHLVTVVTRPKLSAFFTGSKNLNFFPADVDTVYSGFWGLLKLSSKLRKLKPDMVIDLHDNLRSRIVCFLLSIFGISIVRFTKGRRDKKLLTRPHNKVRKNLPHTVERYHKAFQKAGYDFAIMPPPYLEVETGAQHKVEQWLRNKQIVKNETWLGIAPFAAHKTKIWPLENYSKLIEGINRKQNAKYFLFGGGESEISFFQELTKKFPQNCVIVAGELALADELALMKRLDKMICVDSSNMHLATLMGVTPISIWGGTHPATGFGSYGQAENSVVEIDLSELPCRPCSVYGKEVCMRGDFACLNRIQTELVLQKL